MNTIRFSSFSKAIALAACAGTFGLSVPSHAGVIAHWSLDEGSPGAVASGTNSVLDGSGNNHHGTPFGGPVYQTFAPGDTGLDFSSDHIRVTSTSQFASPSLTAEAIIDIDSLPSSRQLRQIVFRGDSQAGKDPFYLGLLGNDLRWLIDDGTAATALHYDVSNFVNQPIHVAGTIDNSSGAMNLYVNGSLVASQTTTVRPTAPISTFAGCGISIGALYDCRDTGQYFDGLISEVRISDTALSPNRFIGASTVPEPATAALMALGLAGLGWNRRRPRALPNDA